MLHSDDVGDIHSTAKGSGARYHSGKPPLHFIPLRIIADYEKLLWRHTPNLHRTESVTCLNYLGLFQETGETEHLTHSVLCLSGCWEECAQVFAYGAKKYAQWNWAKGMAWTIPLACAARHLLKTIQKGEVNDNESCLSHRGHTLCNIVMLLHYTKYYKEGNDLPDPALFKAAPHEAAK